VPEAKGVRNDRWGVIGGTLRARGVIDKLVVHPVPSHCPDAPESMPRIFNRRFFRQEHMIAAFISAPSRSQLPRMLAVLCMSALPLRAALAQRDSSRAASSHGVAAKPGDKVLLKIYREPDLSGEFVVPEDGQVDFPKIGPVRVDRLPTDSLRALLIAQYSHSLRDPAIEVTVLRRVNVTGAVRNPGFYYADPTVTVKGSLALAGGVTPEGDKNRVDLLRDNNRTAIGLSNEASLADSPVQSGDLVSAPERSWFSRNTALVVSGVTGLALVVVTIVRR
jgi:protein involved in polysaccharide export with SLBB domain